MVPNLSPLRPSRSPRRGLAPKSMSCFSRPVGSLFANASVAEGLSRNQRLIAAWVSRLTRCTKTSRGSAQRRKSAAPNRHDAPNGPKPGDGVQIVVSDAGGVATTQIMQDQGQDGGSFAAHDLQEKARGGDVDTVVLRRNRNGQLNRAGSRLHVACGFRVLGGLCSWL